MKAIVFASLLFASFISCAANLPAKPNIVFIITDDQGYGDLSCHGNPILKTPNLDKLHGESARFTDFLVSPTCAPTRASLMTGRHEFFSGVTHTINERERLSPKATILPQILKSAGYTTGVFGKWHLGDEPAYQPEQRGFDEAFIHGAGGIGQSYAGSCGDTPGNTYFSPWVKHNGRFVKSDGYCTDVFFAQAAKWIEAKKGTPFLAWIATNAPHAPLQVRPEDEAIYKGEVAEMPSKFFGMIHNIDENVGRLMGKLKEWDLEKNTIVIFMTDNGGTVGTRIHNAGMRAAKNTPYLGGIRVPFFVRWPGMIAPGDRAQLAAHIDVLPTLAQMTGAKVPEDVVGTLQGRSLLPALLDAKAPWDDRVLFTHCGRWAKGKAAESKYLNCSVRNTRYHMVSAAKDGAKAWELYDVKADIGEKTDLAKERREVVKELAAAYDKWWDAALKGMENEDAVPAKENPFKVEFEKQTGQRREDRGSKIEDRKKGA